MTWSLKLAGGDLVKGRGNSLETSTGSDKVQQDLRNWILTEYGSDPLAPTYGSVINFESDTMVQNPNDPSTVMYVHDDKLTLIVEEVDRIVQLYQINQYARLQQEVIQYNGQHTFSSGEIIQSYQIEYEQLETTLYVDVILTMLNDTTVTVPLTVE